MYNENAQETVYRQRNLLRILKQRGKINDIVRDRGRIGQPPGKRISKTGRVYWETRKNRSDALNSTT